MNINKYTLKPQRNPEEEGSDTVQMYRESTIIAIIVKNYV